MILTAFRLCRDRHTEHDSFGHVRPVLSLNQIIPTYFPSLGCPIELNSIKIKTNIVKIVEYYNRNRGRIIVERLCWRFGTALYPYKARFIHIDKPDTRYDADLLFLPNLAMIHRTLTNNHITFTSPIQYYFNSTSPPWHRNHNHEYLSYLNNKYKDWIGRFAYAHDCWADTERFVNTFDDCTYKDDSEDKFKTFHLPKPPTLDPFTLNNNSLPISTRNIIFENISCNMFDVSPPVELVINHPDKTIYSPKINRTTIGALEQIALQYSDLSLEYILSGGGAVVSCKENYLVSRYRDRVIIDVEKDCRWIVVNEVLETLYHKFHDARIVSDIKVTFVMTYGEEALIEVFEYYTNECLGVVHFDMAMLVLCVPSIAAAADPF
jgi:hypothetical protein